MNDKENILNLKDGECYIVPESDYGKAEIWLKNGIYFLFEIQQYGGTPRYMQSYNRNCVDDLIQNYKSWT